ncbi:hypothetical protein GQ457_01G027520 [Hibiscus cannabinus]
MLPECSDFSFVFLNIHCDQPTTESYAPKEAQTSSHHVAHDPRAQFSTKQVAKEVKTQQNLATTSPIRPKPVFHTTIKSRCLRQPFLILST